MLMGNDKVALMDVDTENDSVVKACYDCIGPSSKSIASTVCGSTPLGIFARIYGNHSRRLPDRGSL